MRTFWNKARQIYGLAAPYGRRKLAVMFLVALAQGLLQVVGVTSIFPFLALASNPSAFMNSGMGMTILQYFPDLDERQLLIFSGLFAVAMLGLSNAMLLFGEVFRARYVQGLGHWLRVNLLSRMVSNPYNYFLNRNTGELIKKAAGDVMNFISGILAPLMDLMARIITVGLLLATLLWLSPTVTLVAGLILTLFYVGVYKVLGKLRKTTSDGLKEANRGAMKEALQCLSGIKPIKVHGAEAFFLNRYAKHTGNLARLSKWMPVVTNGPRYLIEPMAFGGIVIVVLYYLISGGSLEGILPVLGVMALAGYRLLPNIQLMYGALSGISLSSHALEEIYEELHSDDPKVPASIKSVPFPLSVKPIQWEKQIELRDIRFSYEGATRPVLNHLNLVIPKNHFFAFIGETGSGKSTLIDLILGLHWPESGSLLVDGKALDEKDKRAWRAGIGYVPQDIFLMDDTIASNIAFGIPPQKRDRERVREVAAALGAAEVRILDFGDGGLRAGPEEEEILVAELRRLRPEAVLGLGVAGGRDRALGKFVYHGQGPAEQVA